MSEDQTNEQVVNTGALKPVRGKRKPLLTPVKKDKETAPKAAKAAKKAAKPAKGKATKADAKPAKAAKEKTPKTPKAPKAEGEKKKTGRKPAEVTPREGDFLNAAASVGKGARLSAIGGKINASPACVTSLVNRLRSKGYLRTVDGTDNRSRAAELTAKGRKWLEARNAGVPGLHAGAEAAREEEQLAAA